VLGAFVKDQAATKGRCDQRLHQRQQTTESARWKTGARKPVKVLSGQIGNQAAFVVGVRHGERNQTPKSSGFIAIGIVGVS
jgi:hypothetical protein